MAVVVLPLVRVLRSGYPRDVVGSRGCIARCCYWFVHCRPRREVAAVYLDVKMLFRVFRGRVCVLLLDDNGVAFLGSLVVTLDNVRVLERVHGLLQQQVVPLLALVVLEHVSLLSAKLVDLETHFMVGLSRPFKGFHKAHGFGAHPLDGTLKETHPLVLLHVQVVLRGLPLHREKLHLNFKHMFLVRYQKGLLILSPYHILQVVQVVA